MFKSKISKNFVSDLDSFFHEFDKKRKTFPESRKKEIEKHRIIFEKRDNATSQEEENIWKDF